MSFYRLAALALLSCCLAQPDLPDPDYPGPDYPDEEYPDYGGDPQCTCEVTSSVKHRWREISNPLQELEECQRILADEQQSKHQQCSQE